MARGPPWAGACRSSSLLARPLPARDLKALGPLARARVGLGVLAADWQPAAVAQSPVARDLLQPFDVLRALAPQVPLHRHAVVDRVTQPCHLVLGEITDVGVRTDVHLAEDLVRGRASYPIDVGQADLRPLVQGKVHARDTCHQTVTPG